VRKGVLFGGLAAVAAIAVFQPQSDDGARVSVAGVEPPPEAGIPAGDPLRLPERQSFGETRGQLFGTPPRAAKAAPPPRAPSPPPAAPPLPYRFAGIVRVGKDTQVLVAKGDRVLPVKEGETLEGGYRVQSISAERIELVYLPLGTAERIAVSSSLDAKPIAHAARNRPATTAMGHTGNVPTPDTASLRWKGPWEIRAGSSVSVSLHLSYEGALRAAPMQLRFEPDAVDALSVRPGKFLDRGQFSYRVSPEGSIFVGASAAGASPGEDAELLVVTFRPVKAGAMAGLSMAAMNLQNAGGGPVSYAGPPAYRAATVP
jgi:hypothetical protein